MKRFRFVGAVLFLVCALGFLGWRWRATKPPAVAAAEGHSGEARGNAGAAIREEMHNQLLKSLNLTPEQDARMREIDKAAQANLAEGKKGAQVFQETMNEMSKVLTPEQMENLKKLAMEGDRRMANRQANVLPPGEREKYMKKVETRQRNAHPSAPAHMP